MPEYDVTTGLIYLLPPPPFLCPWLGSYALAGAVPPLSSDCIEGWSVKLSCRFNIDDSILSVSICEQTYLQCNWWWGYASTREIASRDLVSDFFFKREAALSTTRSDPHKLIVRVIWGLGNELSSAVKIQFLVLCDLTGGSLLPRPWVKTQPLFLFDFLGSHYSLQICGCLSCNTR